jgi:hypothetical protein
MIKDAFYSQTLEYQTILEFAILYISNLFLKLSINTSKLSCILTPKKNTSNVLSIPTLSLLFLLYLMYKLF